MINKKKHKQFNLILTNEMTEELRQFNESEFKSTLKMPALVRFILSEYLSAKGGK